MTAPTATDVIQLRVHSIAAGGDGVGRSEGLVVFVPRAAPGDLALVRLESVRGSAALDVLFARDTLRVLATH